MNRLPYWPLLVGVLFALFVHAEGAITQRTPLPAATSAAVRGAELGLLATQQGAQAPEAAAPLASGGASSPAQPDAPRDILIFVDPGHGGYDPGAVHTDAAGHIDLTEAEANLAIALRLADLLRDDGFEVVMARTIDSFAIPDASTPVELQHRVDMANAAGADLYVSIHNNGSENPAQQGTEVYYCADRAFSAENRRLATLVQEGLLRNLRAAGYDTVDRGVKNDASIGHIAVLAPYNLARPSAMPGVLGESLFVSNDADAAALRQDHIRDAIARGYFEGIRAYFE